MPEDQRRVFLEQQFVVREAHYARAYPGATNEVIEVDGRAAGRLYVHRATGEVRVVDIALLPEFRGAGVGTRLLRALQDEATESGRPLTLHVDASNVGARRLYEKLGFRATDDAAGGVYVAMTFS